jgi:hypothetical protein
MQAFKRINTNDDPNLMRVQDNVEQCLGVLTAKEILDGVIIENISVSGTDPTYVSHGLGRDLRGWIVVRSKINSTTIPTITEVAEIDAKDTTKYLSLKCNCDTTISLYVF